MNIPTRAVPWIVAAVMLFFLGLLAMGLYQGELSVPTKGVRLELRRATNPAAFYTLAAFYAALAGLSGYFLVLVLKAMRDPAGTPAAPPPAARSAPVRHGDFKGGIRISEQGRGGHVIVDLASGTHPFWWEFGGGDCIAVVSVPTAAQWAGVPALAPHPRNAFLQELAREVQVRKCPNASFEITDDAILFRQP